MKQKSEDGSWSNFDSIENFESSISLDTKKIVFSHLLIITRLGRGLHSPSDLVFPYPFIFHLLLT